MRISRHAMNTRASAALAVGLIAIPVAAATGHPVASHTSPAVPPPPIPGLTINLTDGRVAATPGERLTYTVSVRDSGVAAARHLKITRTLSPGLQFLSASVRWPRPRPWSTSLPRAPDPIRPRSLAPPAPPPLPPPPPPPLPLPVGTAFY